MIQEETKKTGPKPQVEKKKQAKKKKVARTYFDLNINLTGSKVVRINKKVAGASKAVQIRMERNTDMKGPDVIMVAYVSNFLVGEIHQGICVRKLVEVFYKKISQEISTWTKKSSIEDYTGIKDGNFAFVGKSGTEFPLKVNWSSPFFDFENKDIIVNMVSRENVIPDNTTHCCMSCKGVFDEYVKPVCRTEKIQEVEESMMHVSGICIECYKLRSFRVHELPMLVECTLCKKDVTSFHVRMSNGEYVWKFGGKCVCSECHSTRIVPRIFMMSSSQMEYNTVYNGEYGESYRVYQY